MEPNPTHLKAMNKIIIACPTAEIYTAYSVRWQDIALDGAKIANTLEPIKRVNVLNITDASRVLRRQIINPIAAQTEENVESAGDFIILTYILGRM